MGIDLICGLNQSVLPTLAANSVDLVVTSPPYGKVRDYGKHDWCFKTVSSELFRVLKPGGVVCWNVQDTIISTAKTLEPFKQVLGFVDDGFILHDQIIWDKGQVVFTDPNRWGLSWEYVFILSKGNPKTFNTINDRKNIHAGRIFHTTERTKSGELKGHKKGNRLKEFGRRFAIWQISPAKGIGLSHPASMPLELAENLIFAYSNFGDTILDPFSGSGTTLVAAQRLNRNGIGIEPVLEYCSTAHNSLSVISEPLPLETS